MIRKAIANSWIYCKSRKSHKCEVTGQIISKGEHYHKRQVNEYCFDMFSLSEFGYWLVNKYYGLDSFWTKRHFITTVEQTIKEYGSVDKAKQIWAKLKKSVKC